MLRRHNKGDALIEEKKDTVEKAKIDEGWNKDATLSLLSKQGKDAFQFQDSGAHH